jgi:hypothetical protein
MSRRVFKPTAEQRGCVEAMIGYGIPQAEICLLIKNPETSEPIDLETLRKHFATEIATGATKLKLLVGNRIVASILGRDGGLQSDQARARLAVFFAKARMGWKDTAANGREHVGGPIEYRMRRMCRRESQIRSTGSREVSGLERLADLARAEREDHRFAAKDNTSAHRLNLSHPVCDRRRDPAAAPPLSQQPRFRHLPRTPWSQRNARGTEGSNPAPSSKESSANLISSPWRASSCPPVPQTLGVLRGQADRLLRNANPASSRLPPDGTSALRDLTLARQLTAAGVGFTLADNAFLRIDDWERAQALADTLSPRGRPAATVPTPPRSVEQICSTAQHRRKDDHLNLRERIGHRHMPRLISRRQRDSRSK